MAERSDRHQELSRWGERLTLGFIARATLLVVGLWALANMFWLGRDLVFVSFFAVLVGAFLSIFVDPLERLGVPRALAAVVVMLVSLGVLVGLFVLAWPTLQAQFAVIRQQLPQALAEAGAWLESQYQVIIGQLGRPDAEIRQQIEARVARELAELVSGALPLLNTVLGTAVGVLLVLFAGLYLAIESRLYVRGFTALFPAESRDRIREALGAVGDTLRNWMLGTGIGMLLIGVLTTLGLWLLGIPAAFALGLIAGLFEFVPYFGPVLSAVPAVAVAFIVSPTQALWVVLLYIAIQQVESNVIHPLIMKGVVHLPPALTVLFAALMALLFGFLGLLLAVPILAAVKTLTQVLYVDDRDAEERGSAD